MICGHSQPWIVNRESKRVDQKSLFVIHNSWLVIAIKITNHELWINALDLYTHVTHDSRIMNRESMISGIVNHESRTDWQILCAKNGSQNSNHESWITIVNAIFMNVNDNFWCGIALNHECSVKKNREYHIFMQTQGKQDLVEQPHLWLGLAFS